MDFNVKEIQMGVDNIANGNSVIRKFTKLYEFLGLCLIIMHFLKNCTEAALNLFINSNAQELLKEMKPALRTKLTQIIRNFMDRIFAKIPLDEWIKLD